MAYRLPILTYHSLDATGSVISTTPGAFQRQLQWLRQHDYRSIPLREAASQMRAGQPFEDRTVVLTFDDGYETVYREAFPIMQEYGFTATIFLITAYCGKTNSWPGHESPVGEQPLLSWGQITEMARHGIEFGSHTATHPDLAQVSPKQAEQELRASKQAIEDHLGRPAETFAYPYGHYSPASVDLVRSLFTAGCSTILGKVTARADSALLPRVDMYYCSRNRLIESLETRRMDWYLAARRALRSAKQLAQ